MEAVSNIDNCPGEFRVGRQLWKESEVHGHLEQLLCFYRSIRAY